MKVNFVTPTRLSLINLTTIGDSEKREDTTKIGQFSSGQAYATALLLRNGVKLNIQVFGGKHFLDEDNIFEENYTEYIDYSTKELVCKSTEKTKEVVVLNYIRKANTLHDKIIKIETIETAFALQLGYNWELWMALRELWSNMLDEKGYVNTEEKEFGVGCGTIITLEFDETNPFFEVWQNRHLYINEKEPLYILDDKTEVLENTEGYLRIYKQNILVYSDEDIPSRFAWNIKMGEIDERRLIRNIYSIEQDITNSIMRTSNEEFLRKIITKDFTTDSKEFLSSNYCSWQSPSDLIHDICYEIYSEHGEVKSYDWIISKIKERKDCKIGGKKIKTVEDSIWSYSKTVTVESTPQPHSEPSITVDEVEYKTPFEVEIEKYYNFKLDVEVKIAKLRGSKVVADKHEKCLIISEDFSVENDFAEFIVQYLDLTQEGNVVKNMSNYIVGLIKK